MNHMYQSRGGCYLCALYSVQYIIKNTKPFMFLDIKESIFTKVLFDSSFWVPFVFQEYLKDYVNCLKYQELVTDEDTLALKTALWALVGSAGLLFLHDAFIYTHMCGESCDLGINISIHASQIDSRDIYLRRRILEVKTFLLYFIICAEQFLLWFLVFQLIMTIYPWSRNVLWLTW